MHISPANSRSFPRKETAQNVKPNEPGFVTKPNMPQRPKKGRNQELVSLITLRSTEHVFGQMRWNRLVERRGMERD